MRIIGSGHPPLGFDLVTNGEQEHAQERYVVTSKRNRVETERAIAVAEVKAKEVEI